MAQLIEGDGSYFLYRNSDGSYFVEGNGEKEVVRDYGSISTISNMVAAETIVYQGQTYRTIVFDGGHTWFVDTDWSKNGPQYGDFDSLGFDEDYQSYYGLTSSYSGEVPDYTESSGDSTPPPSPTPVAQDPIISNITVWDNGGTTEGDTVYVTVRTTAAPILASLNYNITGVSSSDIGIPTSGVIPVPNITNSQLPEVGSRTLKK